MQEQDVMGVALRFLTAIFAECLAAVRSLSWRSIVTLYEMASRLSRYVRCRRL